MSALTDKEEVFIVTNKYDHRGTHVYCLTSQLKRNIDIKVKVDGIYNAVRLYLLEKSDAEETEKLNNAQQTGIQYHPVWNQNNELLFVENIDTSILDFHQKEPFDVCAVSKYEANQTNTFITIKFLAASGDAKWRRKWSGYMLEFFDFFNPTYRRRSKPISVAASNKVTHEINLPMEQVEGEIYKAASFQAPEMNIKLGYQDYTVNIIVTTTDAFVSPLVSNLTSWTCMFGNTPAPIRFVEHNKLDKGHQIIVGVRVPAIEGTESYVPVSITCHAGIGSIQTSELTFEYINDDSFAGIINSLSVSDQTQPVKTPKAVSKIVWDSATLFPLSGVEGHLVKITLTKDESSALISDAYHSSNWTCMFGSESVPVLFVKPEGSGIFVVVQVPPKVEDEVSISLELHGEKIPHGIPFKYLELLA